MEIAIIIILVIAVIILSIRLLQYRQEGKRHKERILELEDTVEAQKETAEMAEALIAENQRLLAEQAMKPKWEIGGLNKEPGQSNKK